MASSISANSHSPRRKSVLSADSTLIAYFEYISPSPKSKPGLIILHDGFDSSRTYTDMAYALWTSFDVYVPDRRGRGYSGQYQPDSDLQTEVNDLRALLSDTGAQYVLGVGSGASLALCTACHVAMFDNDLSIKKIAAFEPLILPEDNGKFGELREKLEQQIDGGRVMDPEALFTALKSW